MSSWEDGRSLPLGWLWIWQSPFGSGVKFYAPRRGPLWCSTVLVASPSFTSSSASTSTAKPATSVVFSPSCSPPLSSSSSSSSSSTGDRTHFSFSSILRFRFGAGATSSPAVAEAATGEHGMGGRKARTSEDCLAKETKSVLDGIDATSDDGLGSSGRSSSSNWIPCRRETICCSVWNRYQKKEVEKLTAK